MADSVGYIKVIETLFFAVSIIAWTLMTATAISFRKKQDEMERDLKQILAQTIKTNGRVDGLEQWRASHEAGDSRMHGKLEANIDNVWKRVEFIWDQVTEWRSNGK